MMQVYTMNADCLPYTEYFQVLRTRYGKLVSGAMKFSWRMLPGYKAVRFGVIPGFDQGTQFVYQLDPVESETEIFIGVGIGTIAA